MKKSSLALVALLIAAPVFADEVKAEAPLTLASADTSVSTNLQAIESADLGARLDKEVKEFTKALSEKIDAELSAAVTEQGVTSVKF